MDIFDNTKIYKTKEILNILKISKLTFYRLLKKGKIITNTPPNATKRILGQDLNNYLALYN